MRVGVAATAALLVTVTALCAALIAAAGTRDADRQLSGRLVPAAGTAGVLLAQYTDQQNDLRNFVSTGRRAPLGAFLSTARQTAAVDARLDRLVSEYPGLPALVRQATTAHRAWLQHVARPQLTAALTSSLRHAQALQADIPRVRPYVLAVRSRLARVQAKITAEQRAVTAQLTSSQGLLIGALLVMCLLVAVISVGGMLTVRRWLIRPLTALRGAADAVASGTYHTPIPVGGPTEFADLGRSTERMRTALISAASERIEMQAEQERLRAEAERDRVSRRLQQSERLESLGHLVGGVAHDFNNLLGVIIGYADFAADQLADLDGDARIAAVNADVAQVRGAADQAARLTRQLLTFARRDVIRPQLLDLNDVAMTTEQLLRRTIGEHIELVARPGEDLWPVFADRGQVEQVLVNLAINSRDAMPRGGRLSVETGNVDVDAAYADTHPGLRPGRYVRLRVSDTGAGMDRETIDRVFEPFFTTKPKGVGTGLGLATVYGIVTQAEGVIQIYSEPGMGTAVSVLLPARDTPAADGQAPAGGSCPAPDFAGDGGRGTSVLLVEDEEAIRELTRRILAGDGYQVKVAVSGSDAVGLAARPDVAVDLLLTDVVMPGMLGTEVAARVRELRPGLPVLYMSGYAEPILNSHGAASADMDIVEKPFTQAAILGRVRAALAARSPAEG